MQAKTPIQFSSKIGRFYFVEPPSKRDAQTLKECDSFYTNDVVEYCFIPLITQKHSVSLRSLDWLATNYSKKNQLIFVRIDNNENYASQLSNVHNNYNAKLKKNKRKRFDPFRRRKRIYFHYKDEWYSSTIGQLEFLKWVIKSDLLKFAESHIKEINKDMYLTKEKNKKEKDEAKKAGIVMGRKELSKSMHSACIAYKVNDKNNFDMNVDSTKMY